MSRPTVPVRPARRLRASWFGVNEICSAASSTRRRVAGATSSRPLIAFDAVAIETPASFATSLSVDALPLPGSSARAIATPSP